MAVGDYIPARDAELIEWGNNFVTLLVANPLLYGITAPEAAQLQALYNDFRASWLLAVDPGTRSKPTVAEKDEDKALFVFAARRAAQRIKLNLGTDTDSIIALGLSVDDITPTPRMAPATQPIVSILAATPFQHTIRVADSATPNKRAQPFGSVGCLIVGNIGTVVGTDPEEAEFMAVVTRFPAAINYDVDTVGKIATLWGAWMGSRGDLGPWSSPAVMHIVGGGLPASPPG